MTVTRPRAERGAFPPGTEHYGDLTVPHVPELRHQPLPLVPFSGIPCPSGQPPLRRSRYPPDESGIPVKKTKDRKSTRLNSSHLRSSRMPSSA